MECMGATFEDGLLSGTPESLTWTTSSNCKCTFKGSFKAGMPHGKGMLQYDNKIASGNWVNGVLQRDTDDSPDDRNEEGLDGPLPNLDAEEQKASMPPGSAPK